MAISELDIIAGILTITPLFIGYFMGIVALNLYRQKRNPLLLLSSILFFSFPSPWLGVSSVFIAAVLGLDTPSDQTYVFIYAWSVPVLATVWNYITASLSKNRPKLKYIVLSIFLVLDAIFLWSIYINGDYDVHPVEDSIFYDSSFEGMASIIVLIMAVSFLVYVGPFYLWVSKKTEDPLFKFKSRLIGIGAFLFVIIALVDGTLELSNIFPVLIIRTVLIIALILLYFGYITPNWIRNRYQ